MTRKYPNAGLPDDLFKCFCDEIEAMREAYGKRVTIHIMSLIGCSREEARKHADNLSKLYREINRLTPRKLIQIEGLISDELFGDIAKYVFNHYDWPAELDEDIDRIARRYRSEDTAARKALDVTSQLLNIIYIELICSVCSQYGFRRFESVSGYCLSKYLSDYAFGHSHS